MQQNSPSQEDLGFPVPSYRFDQKNDVYKRSRWDEKIRPYAAGYYQEVKYREKPGYGVLDYAFRNAGWTLEATAAFGNSRSNYGLYAWEGMPSRYKQYVENLDPVKRSPEEMSYIIKKVAHFYGADLLGVCRVHPNWIYSHEYNLMSQEHYPIEIPEGCNKAIVMAIEMDYETIRTSPSPLGGAASGLAYSQMAFVAGLLAIFIRGIGYRAIPSGNDTAINVPLALAAGLGEGSRSGLLITEKLGPRLRLCKVFTDLPLLSDSYKPFGVTEFCKTCKKCAEHCPSQAISHSEMSLEGPNISSHSGIKKWYIDGEKCFAFWSRNHAGCTNCIQVCPYNKPPGVAHDMVRAVTKRTYLFNRLFVWADTLFKYDKPANAERFWKPTPRNVHEK